jgi:H/ACA ribonucleoprotein complex non-core subunit NAF1
VVVNSQLSDISLVNIARTTTTMAEFKVPFNPAIPQDLSFIAEMVNAEQVVGSAPRLEHSVSEKRRLVEQSLKNVKGKGKAAVKADDSQSSSSEEDSSSEEEAGAEQVTGGQKAMTAEEHEELKLQLDQMVGKERNEDGASDSSSDSSSDEDEEDALDGIPEFEFSNSPLPSPRAPKRAFNIAIDMMDDEEPTTMDPIVSQHEVAVLPVALPPLERLPEGEGTQLAGEVISWMKEKKVEIWWELQHKRGEPSTAAPGTDEVLPVQDAGGQSELVEPDPVKDEEEEVLELLEVVSRSSTRSPEPQVPGPQAFESNAVESSTVNHLNKDTQRAPEVQMETGESSSSSIPAIPNVIPLDAGVAAPRFGTSGTVVIRAMQSRPGSDEDGWLEEGSVLCHQDGRVLGTVSRWNGLIVAC